MADNFQTSKVASNEQASAAKFNTFVQAVQDAINSLDNSNVAAAAALSVSKLAAGSNGDVLTTSSGTPTWAPLAAGAGYATTLPGSPTNGQLTYLVDSTTTPTYCWAFRFNSAKASNKWDFIGGSPRFAEVVTAESSSSTTYTDLSTVGPSIAVPVAGDYLVTIGCRIANSINDSQYRMSYAIGGSAATDNDSFLNSVSTLSGGGETASRTRKKTGLTAVTLTAKYRRSDANGNTGTYDNRWMELTPIAVGG